MMMNRMKPIATPERTTAGRRIVEIAGPQRLSLRERVERARRAMEGDALERLRRDVCRRRDLSQ